MKIIVHRRNTIHDLIATNPKYGIEVDVRTEADQLIIHHDPYLPGESFDKWIKFYQHQTLILNLKEEGLEEKLISLMSSMNISDFFFLDQSFPFLIKWSKLGERRCAVRVSEFESIETALALAGKVDWAWIDCFNKFPLTSADCQKLKLAGFKLCLVSPELHGRDAEIEIPSLISLIKKLNIQFEAVCTKRPDIWERY